MVLYSAISGMTRNDSSLSSNAEPQLPPEWVRTVLSLLFVIHLFAVGVALIGRMPVSSELFRRLANVRFLAAYRQLLDMDLPYNYPLTRADTLDIDHSIEAVVKLPDGKTEVVTLPPAGIPAGERARHWRQLTQNMAMFVGNPDIESILPTHLGLGLVKRYGGDEVVLKLRGRYLQDREAMSRGADPMRNDLLRDLYEARVWLSDDRPRIMKKEGVGESAPAAANAERTQPAFPTIQ